MDLLLGCSDVTVICEENGVRRPCTTNDVTKAGLCQQSEFLYLSPPSPPASRFFFLYFFRCVIYYLHKLIVVDG